MCLTGLPPQSCFVGMSRPGGTTLPGAIYAPFSILAPSRMTQWSPITTSSSMWHEYRVHLAPIVTLFPITTPAGMPVGRAAAVWMTVLSPTEVNFPIETELISPLMTALYQTEDHCLILTSPTIQTEVVKQSFSLPTDSRVGCNPAVLDLWLDIVQRKLHAVF